MRRGNKVGNLVFEMQIVYVTISDLLVKYLLLVKKDLTVLG